MKKEFHRLEDCEHMIVEILRQGGNFRFYPKGTSMLPFIKQGRDMVVLSPLPKKLRRYQVILYKRENGAFVLHRIVRVKKDSCVMRGDNQVVSEVGVRRDMMIGMVTEVICDEKSRDILSFAEMTKAMLWVETAWVRRCLF